jgi:uncharacterized protein YkwD
MDGRRLSQLLRTTALALALGALAFTTPSASAHAPRCGAAAHARAVPTAASAGAILCLVNRHRAYHRLAPLRLNAALSSSAQGHSAQMVADRYFSHTGAGNSTLASRIGATSYLRGARAWALGETLAWAGGAQATPVGLVSILIHSPPHRAILLDPTYLDIGVGIGAGAPVAGTPGATLTLDLGRATH